MTRFFLPDTSRADLPIMGVAPQSVQNMYLVVSKGNSALHVRTSARHTDAAKLITCIEIQVISC